MTYLELPYTLDLKSEYPLCKIIASQKTLSVTHKENVYKLCSKRLTHVADGPL